MPVRVFSTYMVNKYRCALRGVSLIVSVNNVRIVDLLECTVPR